MFVSALIYIQPLAASLLNISCFRLQHIFIVPLCTMNTEHSGDILCGVCPIIVFSAVIGFMTTTDNGSLGLPISWLQEISSPDRLLSNLIIYVVATNHSVYLKSVTINISVWSFAVCTQLVHIYLDCFHLLSQVHVAQLYLIDLYGFFLTFFQNLFAKLIFYIFAKFFRISYMVTIQSFVLYKLITSTVCIFSLYCLDAIS